MISNITENVLTDQSAGSVQDDGNLKIEQSEAGGKEVNSHLEVNVYTCVLSKVLYLNVMYTDQ